MLKINFALKAAAVQFDEASVKYQYQSLTYLLLETLVHLDSIDLDKTEGESLSSGKITQTKQQLTNILKQKIGAPSYQA